MAIATLHSEPPSLAALDALAGGEVFVAIDGLHAGYGRMEILHGVDLRLARGQALCLIGPNGAGKSTVLHSIFGFTRITGGTIRVAGADVTRIPPAAKVARARIAYILQDSSIFPNMTVEENLWMGGYRMPRPSQAKAAADRVFDKYPRLAQRRHTRAGALSGGERRLLEISRALVMDPELLLVDEPSIGLEPRFIDEVFEILRELVASDGRTVLMVEQNARKGLEFADVGYVLVAGRV